MDSGIFSGTCCFCFSGYKLIGIYLDYKTGTDEYRICSSIRRKLQNTGDTGTDENRGAAGGIQPAEPSEPEPEPLSYPTEPPLAVDFESLKSD